MPTARRALLGALIVVVAAALFGSLGVSARFAYAEGMEPFAFVAWRAGVGAVGLWLVVAAIRGPGRILADLRAMDRRAARWLGLAIVLGSGLNLAAFLSFDNTTVALALLGFYTYPAMVAAGSVLLGREQLDARAGGRARCSRSRGWSRSSSAGRRSSRPHAARSSASRLALAAAAFQTAFVLTSRGYAGVPAEQAMGAILAGSSVAGRGDHARRRTGPAP